MLYAVYILILGAALVITQRFIPKYPLLSVPMCILMDLVIYWEYFSYYESRPMMILLTFVQAGLAVVFAVGIGKKL